MRKATGKVVSLVLALALVITSFSATFASAASTKTESAASVSAENGTVYLANLSNLSGEDLSQAKKDGKDKFSLTKLVAGAELETYDHMKVTSAEISSVSVSGDNIIRVTEENDEYIVTVRDVTATGTATINVLYTGETTDTRNDETITVRGSKKFTVVLLDAKTPILGVAGADGNAEGAGVDAISNLQKNPAAGAGSYKNGDNGKPVTYDEAEVYLPVSGGNTYAAGSNSASALAKYEVQNVIEYDADKDYYTSTDLSTLSDATYETVYVVSTNSGSKNYIDVETTNNETITYGIESPSVGNTVRVTVQSLKKTDTPNQYAINKTVAQSTAKVENKVVGAFTEIKLGDGSTKKINADGTEGTLSKSKAYAKIQVSGNDYFWDVTGAQVIADGTLEIYDGKLGNVSAGGKITVTDATVGTIENKDYDVEINGASVSGVDGATKVTVQDGATVGTIKNATTVDVKDGKVTGSVSATNVNLIPASDEVAVSVGAVSATNLTVNGLSSKASAASFFASNAGVLTLKGDKASIGEIDADYRATEIKLENFVGTLSAIKNAYDTGYDASGAKLSSLDDEDEVATKATVSSALSIENISLESGAVTFAGKVAVDEVGGGDADFIINAGALNINKGIATSNTLKIADTASVVPGTLVFTASSDIADVDSFVNYGFDLKLVSSSSYDGFVIESVDFAGLTLDVGDSIELVVGETVVVTASAYPNGTKLPEGTKIEFYLNDADLNYIEGKNLGNNQASVTALQYNEDFSVLNKGKLVAVVLDEYDIQLEEYGEAVCDITVVKTKTPTETYKSDTTGDVVVAKGNTYQFKITSLNGQTPSVVLGSDGVFELVGTSVEGSDYFFKFQAVGASGAATGVYVNGDAKVATLYVDGNTGYTCDTTTVNVPAGGTYQVKITAASMPTLLPGNSIYTVAFASQEGNDYFFKITATSAQAGDVVGFYINGGARAFVATTV